MAKKRWTREGPQSGPANVLDGRWEVRRDGARWGIWDRETKMWMGGCATLHTMRAAREMAEAVATDGAALRRNLTMAVRR